MCVCRRWRNIIEADRMWTKHTSALAKKKKIVLLQSLHTKKEEEKLRAKRKGKNKELPITQGESDVDFRTLLRGVYDIRGGYAEQIYIYLVGPKPYPDTIIKSLKKVIFPDEEGVYVQSQATDTIQVYFNGCIYQLVFEDWRKGKFIEQGKGRAVKKILAFLVPLTGGANQKNDRDTALRSITSHPSIVLASKETPIVLLGLKSFDRHSEYLSDSEDSSENEEKEEEKEKEEDEAEHMMHRAERRRFFFIDFGRTMAQGHVGDNEDINNNNNNNNNSERDIESGGGVDETSPLLQTKPNTNTTTTTNNNTTENEGDMVDVEIGTPQKPQKRDPTKEALTKVYSKRVYQYAKQNAFNCYGEVIWHPEKQEIENPRELFIALLKAEDNMEKDVLDESTVDMEKERLMQRQRGNACVPLLHMTEGFLCALLLPILLLWALALLLGLYLFSLGKGTYSVLTGRLAFYWKIPSLPFSWLLITLVAVMWFIIVSLSFVLVVMNLPTAARNGYRYGVIHASKMGILQVWNDETTVILPTLGWMWRCFA